MQIKGVYYIFKTLLSSMRLKMRINVPRKETWTHDNFNESLSRDWQISGGKRTNNMFEIDLVCF